MSAEGTPLSENVVQQQLGGRLLATSIPALEYILDPFHDNAIACAGYPDSNTGASVVQVFTREVAFSCAAASDIRVHMTQILNTYPTSKSTVTFNTNDNYYTSPIVSPDLTQDDATLMGGMRIDVRASGSTFNQIFDPTGNTATYVLGPFKTGTGAAFTDFDDVVANYSDYRCIGNAFEIVNTSAQLYKGGSLTTYLSEDTSVQDTVMIDSVIPVGGETTSAYLPFVVDTIDTLPQTVAEIKQTPRSQTWEASKGVYAVANFYDTSIPVSRNKIQGLLCYDRDGSYTNGNLPTVYGLGQNDIHGLGRAHHLGSFYPYGAFVLGAAAQSTFTIRARWVIELFPRRVDNALIVLATPSAPFDPRALEAISVAMVSKPLGTPVANNAHGGWFKKILSLAADSVKFLPLQLKERDMALQGIRAMDDARRIGNQLIAKEPKNPRTKQLLAMHSRLAAEVKKKNAKKKK